MNLADERLVFGLVLVVTQACIAAPILTKLVRTKDRTGYSLTGEAVWCLVGAGWLCYGLGIHSVILVISGAIAVVTSFLVTVLIFSNEKDQLKLAGTFSGLALVLLVVGFVVAGIDGLSVALSILSVVQFIPQLEKSARALKSHEKATGVSVVGAALRSLYTFGWAVYAGAWFLWGIPVSEIAWPLFIWGIVGTVAFVLQAFVAIRTRSYL